MKLQESQCGAEKGSNKTPKVKRSVVELSHSRSALERHESQAKEVKTKD